MAQIAESLASAPGVRGVGTSPATGRITIHYDPAEDSDFPQALAGYARNSQLLELATQGDGDPEASLVDRAVQACEWLNGLQFAFSSYVHLQQDEPARRLERKVDLLRSELAGLGAALNPEPSKLETPNRPENPPPPDTRD